MIPATMFPEIYFWESAFFLLLAFEAALVRRSKKMDLLDDVMYAVVELGSFGASLYLLYLGGV